MMQHQQPAVGPSVRINQSLQIRANTSKIEDLDDDYYFEVNTPNTDSSTEASCKSPTECPDDDDGRDRMPWTKVKLVVMSI